MAHSIQAIFQPILTEVFETVFGKSPSDNPSINQENGCELLLEDGCELLLENG